ncbi:hypothetical protein [Oerskovia enterophila]|uniref:hypothetical protein n=1 Tax=Oerskovia enterophila TaxID=43678 RepID=UPI00380D764A
MSLFIRLTVGHHMVDRIRVSRVSNTDENVLDPDTVSTYQVDTPAGRDRQGYIVWRTVTTISHRYGDGATELARLALNALKENT